MMKEKEVGNVSIGGCMKKQFECPECEGEGIEMCSCCDSELGDCEFCEGTGVDAEIVDIKAFKAAENQLASESTPNAVYGTWALVEGGVCTGRANTRGIVRYNQFLRNK
jgi:hypothetical protein